MHMMIRDIILGRNRGFDGILYKMRLLLASRLLGPSLPFGHTYTHTHIYQSSSPPWASAMGHYTTRPHQAQGTVKWWSRTPPERGALLRGMTLGLSCASPSTIPSGPDVGISPHAVDQCSD